MAQHFLLSAKARTLSLKSIYQAGEEAAYVTFRTIRWPATDGEAVCPRCGCLDTYDIPTRRKPAAPVVLAPPVAQIAPRRSVKLILRLAKIVPDVTLN